MQANIPDDWIGKRTTVQYKTDSYEEGQAWGVSVIHGRLQERNDLGIIVEDTARHSEDSPKSLLLIAYDAIVTVDVTL